MRIYSAPLEGHVHDRRWASHEQKNVGWVPTHHAGSCAVSKWWVPPTLRLLGLTRQIRLEILLLGRAPDRGWALPMVILGTLRPPSLSQRTSTELDPPKRPPLGAVGRSPGALRAAIPGWVTEPKKILTWARTSRKNRDFIHQTIKM